MIPKIIHYCWFGGAEMPDEYAGYIAEWEALHPEWEIKRWDESNSPVDILYLQNALELKNWANCSNFIRLWALENFGGIYLDIDFKLIKPLDLFLTEDCFFGFEEGEVDNKIFWVNNAICGSIKNHSFIKECYHFLNRCYDGSEQANLSGPRLTTELLKINCGLINYGLQTLQGITLFPKEYFYPIHYSEVYKIPTFEKYILPETIGIHVWARTWLSRECLLQIVDDLYQQNNELKISLNEVKAENTTLKLFNNIV